MKSPDSSVPPDLPVVTSDNCNCFALRQAARYVTQLYERHLDPVGVTSAQFSIMSRLSRRPGQGMQELAEGMVMDRTTVVRTLKPMQRDGLIESGPAGHDARANVFRLTEAGRRRFAEAVVAWRAAQHELEERFGEARTKALRAELFNLTATD